MRREIDSESRKTLKDNLLPTVQISSVPCDVQSCKNVFAFLKCSVPFLCYSDTCLMFNLNIKNNFE